MKTVYRTLDEWKLNFDAMFGVVSAGGTLKQRTQSKSLTCLTVNRYGSQRCIKELVTRKCNPAKITRPGIRNQIPRV